MTIGTLSAETGLHKSTVHRLLATMCTRGYVQRDAETSVYRAGMRLCELSSYIVENMDVIEARPRSLERVWGMKLERLSTVLQEERDIVYLHKVESVDGADPHVFAYRHAPPAVLHGRGQGHPSTAGRGKRALWRASDVRPWTPYTIVDEAAFFQELAQVRRLGYAMDNENELGVCAASRRRFRIIGGAPRMRSRFPRR